MKLNDVAVRKLLPNPERRLLYVWDDSVKGFAVRVTSAGAKSFVLRYRVHNRQRELTIGNCSDWSTTAAREKAKEYKRASDDGTDPMDERHAERIAPTMRDLWKRYEKEHLPHLALMSQKDQAAMWRDYILPVLGSTKVAAVRPSDIDTIHSNITALGRRARANRVVEVLRKAFNLSVRWDYRRDNPTTGTRRNGLEPRTRRLNRGEALKLLEVLEGMNDRSAANAIRFLLLTGARKGEVLSATWGEFDLEGGRWTKPSAHTKQRRLHMVPLSTDAVALLRKLGPSKPIEYVFAGAEEGEALRDISRCWEGVRIAAKIPDCRLHDLRRTFASILASSGVTLHEVGALLGHTQAQTTQGYAYLFDDNLRRATERLVDFLN